MYVKVTNGVPTPYTIGQLRKDNPNVSFPRQISEQTLQSFGVFPFTRAAYPTYDKRTQKLEVGDIEQVNGKWVEQWNVVNRTQEEVSQQDAIQEAKIRSDRDERLAQSDWTQVADAPVNQEAWSTYRQALRDVPAQEGFPWSVTWPTQPE